MRVQNHLNRSVEHYDKDLKGKENMNIPLRQNNQIKKPTQNKINSMKFGTPL